MVAIARPRPGRARPGVFSPTARPGATAADSGGTGPGRRNKLQFCRLALPPPEARPMLTLRTGPARPNCDGTTRRAALKAGFLAAAGLGLPDFLRAKQRQGPASEEKS